MERLLVFVLLNFLICTQSYCDPENKRSDVDSWHAVASHNKIVDYKKNKSQSDLKKNDIVWPKGSINQDIGTRLSIYRDFRSYNQFLLIYNYSEYTLLLRDFKERDRQHTIIPMQLVPTHNNAVLLVKQESID